jgi:hypothetical protein
MISTFSYIITAHKKIIQVKHGIQRRKHNTGENLLTNATVMNDAIRFVSQESKDKEKIKSASETGDK